MDERTRILKDWIEREGRRQDWVAKQVGCSPQWLNYVIKGKKTLSDRLARELHEKLGVPLLQEHGKWDAGTKKQSSTKAKTRKQRNVRTHESQLLTAGMEVSASAR